MVPNTPPMPLRRGPQVDGELSVRGIVTRFLLIIILLLLFLLLIIIITIIAITPASRSSSRERGDEADKSVRRPV